MSRFFKKKSSTKSPDGRPLPNPQQFHGSHGPASDNYNPPLGTYDTVPNDGNYDTGTMNSSERTRAANFMEKPADGWHHDDRAMGAGLGVYFTYPVIYVGKIDLPTSISSMQHDAQTDITREAIARSVDDSLPRKPKNRQLSSACQRYRFGAVSDMMFDVKLSMSARGIIIAPLDDPDGIVGFFPMHNISLATGGENIDYDYVSFTARDNETGQRHSHVFDCGLHSDDVMTDLGQAFALAQELAGKQNQSNKKSSVGQGYLDVVPDGMDLALAPPPGAESLYADLDSINPVANPMYGMNDDMQSSNVSYQMGNEANPTYDSASKQAYFDVAPNNLQPDPAQQQFDQGYFDIIPSGQPQQQQQQPPDVMFEGTDTYFEVDIDPVAQQMAQSLANGNALYDTASGNQTGQQLVNVLNKHDNHVIQEGEDQYMFAEWTAYDTTQVHNQVDVSQYKGKSKLKDIYDQSSTNPNPLYDAAVPNTALYDTAGH